MNLRVSESRPLRHTLMKEMAIISDVFSSALNLIGPRAMDVLSELSYVSMTPEHFPSLFCKVRPTRLLDNQICCRAGDICIKNELLITHSVVYHWRLTVLCFAGNECGLR